MMIRYKVLSSNYKVKKRTLFFTIHDIGMVTYSFLNRLS